MSAQEQVPPLWLKMVLKSDATLGRGDGVAGVVDAEVQHDAYGLPYLSGKTLKGLLTAECAEVLFALTRSKTPDLARWEEAAHFIFGVPGSEHAARGQLHVGDAQLPGDLRAVIAAHFEELGQRKQGKAQQGAQRRAVLDSLTALRRQTAMDETGAPQRNSLRTMRVILRETPFAARLDWLSAPPPKAPWLLAACVSALRRVGTGRHRGRGRVRATLWQDAPWQDGATNITLDWLNAFEQEVRGARSHL